MVWLLVSVCIVLFPKTRNVHHILSLHPGVLMDTCEPLRRSDKMLGGEVTLWWTSNPGVVFLTDITGSVIQDRRFATIINKLSLICTHLH